MWIVVDVVKRSKQRKIDRKKERKKMKETEIDRYSKREIERERGVSILLYSMNNIDLYYIFHIHQNFNL